MQVQLWLWRLSCVFLFGILLGLTATFVLWDDVRSSPCEQFKFPIPYTLYEVTLQHCELAWVVVWRLIKFDVLRCMLLYVAFTQGSAFFKYIFTTIYGNQIIIKVIRLIHVPINTWLFRICKVE